MYRREGYVTHLEMVAEGQRAFIVDMPATDSNGRYLSVTWPPVSVFTPQELRRFAKKLADIAGEEDANA